MAIRKEQFISHSIVVLSVKQQMDEFMVPNNENIWFLAENFD